MPKLMEVLEYLDPTGDTLVARVPPDVEVGVDDAPDAPVGRAQVDAEQAARLLADLVVDQAVHALDRQPAEQRVTVPADAFQEQPALDAGHVQMPGERLRLVGTAVRKMRRDFLQTPHVGVDLGEHACDPLDVEPAVGADAAMDVIGCDPHAPARRRFAARTTAGAPRSGRAQSA